MGAVVREFNCVLVWLAQCLVYSAYLPTLYSLDEGFFRAMPWLRQLVIGLSPGRPVFDLVPVHVRYVWDKVSLGKVFLQVC